MPAAPEEIQVVIGMKHRQTFRDNYLNKYLAQGFIERTIPEKPRSRLQRYRLTEKGRAWRATEAKRADRDPRTAEEQLRQYITQIAQSQEFAPFGFMSNGLNTWLWDVGLAHPRLVAGFFSPTDLERLLFLRTNRQSIACRI